MKTLTYPAVPSLPPVADAPKPRFLPLKPVSLRTAVWSSLLGVAAVGPAMIVSSFFPLSDHSRTAFASVALLPLAGILKHVLLGPVVEEVIYRGGLLPLLRRYLPLWVSVLLMSALFGATHFVAGSATVVIAAAMAALFAWLSVRSESLLPGLVCHMSFNFASGLIIAPSFDVAARLETVPVGGSVASSIGLILPVWWIVASVATAAAALVIVHRETAGRIRPCVTRTGR